MEFFGVFIIGYCLWIAQALNDAQKEQEKEIEITWQQLVLLKFRKNFYILRLPLFRLLILY